MKSQHKGSVTRRKLRPVPCITSNQRLDERLFALLEDPDPRLRLTVYRLRGGERLKPALYTGEPFPGLFDYLRDSHHGGDFALMIRRGKVMELSGAISIWTPPGRNTF